MIVSFLIHAFATACQVARPPVRIRPMHSATEGFYFQAFNGSVALNVAGYDYNSDWTPLLAGLSPAGMAASLAAPDPYVRLSRIRLVWGFLCQGHITPSLVRACCFILLFDPRREHSSVPTAYFHRRRAQRQSRTALAAEGLSLTDASTAACCWRSGGWPRDDPRRACHWSRLIARTTLVFG